MSIQTVPQPLYSPDLGPCNFWLFPKLRDCRNEIIEEMKEAVTKVINTLHKRTSMGPFRSVGTVQQLHCSRRIFFGRGLEFHVCTLSKGAHTKKIWKLIVCASYTYIYIYIYIYKFAYFSDNEIVWRWNNKIIYIYIYMSVSVCVCMCVCVCVCVCVCFINLHFLCFFKKSNICSKTIN